MEITTLREQSGFESEFVISGDIKEIKAELAKEPLDKPDDNEPGVFLGKFCLHTFWDNGDSLSMPDLEIRLNRGHIKVVFPPYCYFREEDEEIYYNAMDYINHKVKEKLNNL